MVYFIPKTKIGKISFLLVILGFFVIIILNIIAGLMQTNDICDAEGLCQPSPGSLEESQSFIFLTRVIPSLLAMGCIIIAGITSIIAILKYHDRAILLFLSALLGLMGIIFALGEFLVPH